jgi:hypothetical protein
MDRVSNLGSDWYGDIVSDRSVLTPGFELCTFQTQSTSDFNSDQNELMCISWTIDHAAKPGQAAWCITSSDALTW